MLYICRTLGVLALAVPVYCNAHQEHAAETTDVEDEVMDCKHPPADAVRELPAPLSRWGRLNCLPYGHTLTQSPDAQWRYPGSFTDRVLISARTSSDEQDAKPRYFTQLSARQLDTAEARAKHQDLMKRIAVYADRLADANTHQTPDVPKSAWEILGINNEKKTIRLYLMQHEGRQDVWGLVCAPECESHLSFILTPYD